jgi:hypothetical protein
VRRAVLALILTLTLLVSSMLIVHPAKSSPRTIVVPDDFPTIRKAIDNASAGDTVYVKAGTYNIAAEGYVSFYSFVCLSISKPISLIGENCDDTIIMATENYPTLFHIGIAVRADNVTISGFTITSNRNIVGLGGNNSILTKNIIKLTGNSGVYGVSDAVYAANGNIVSSNVIEGTGYYYGIIAGSDTTITNNTIRNFDTGISSYSYDYNQSIFDNTIANNSIGLRLTVPALFYHNNIENYSQYSVYCATSDNVNATYNWWGTTNRQEIGQKIFDNKNDSNLGTVTFEPFLTQPNPNATPSANTQTSQFPSPLIFAILAVSIAAVAAGIVVYRKRLKREDGRV